MRLVIDSNLLISHLLKPDSIPAQLVVKAFLGHTVLLSDDLLLELRQTLMRKKFDPYISERDRLLFLHRLHRICSPVTVTRRVRLCRDPDDNKILELALNGKADLIASGDKDLHALKAEFRIPIVTAAEGLRLLS